MVLLNNILLYFFVYLPFFHSNSNSKKTNKKTEYFFNIEILCNIDDYCILLIFLWLEVFKAHRCRFKFAISGRMGICKKNKIFSRS